MAVYFHAISGDGAGPTRITERGVDASSPRDRRRSGRHALLSACNDADEQSEPPPIPDDTPEEPEENAEEDTDVEDEQADEIDVSTVPANPDDIDVEYVQAVMDEIDPIIQAGAAVLATVQDPFHPDVVAVYSSAYEEEAAQRQLAQFEVGVPLEDLKGEPEPPETAVEEVLLATEGCVLFTAQRDFLPLFQSEDAIDVTQPYYLRIEQAEPSDINATAWRLTLDTFFSDPSSIPPIEEACP